jgi:aspartyl-tRNA(Asn)/glutamyl-tRNA(Gln) amidotransferase subunit A
MPELYNRSLEELHSLLVSKEITAQDLTRATIDRIKETEPEVEAFITVE